MKKRIKTEWLNALRGGEYAQTKGALRSKEGYCCLGVLCDLYSKTLWGKMNNAKWDENNHFIVKERCDTGVLPKKVHKWAGLKHPNPEAKVHRLSHYNDKTKIGFKGIADLIENWL